jgi:RNA polymerase sigma factor (sigma-70 family)
MNQTKIYTDNEGLVGWMYNKYKDLYTFWEPEDLLQELRGILWKTIRKWEPKRGKLSTIYWHICKNELNNRYRKWTNQLRICGLKRENYEHTLCNTPDKASRQPYNALLSQNAIRALWNRMELQNIDILEQYYIEGCSTSQIAHRNKVSRQAISQALNRETAKMRRSKFAANFVSQNFS